MADQQDPRQEQYNRARDAFEGLKMEDKTVFLLTETVNTIFEGAETCARTIADEFGAFFGGEFTETEEAEAKASGNGAAKSGAKKTTRAKSTRGKSTQSKSTRSKTGGTKKTTSRRKSTKKDESDDA